MSRGGVNICAGEKSRANPSHSLKKRKEKGGLLIGSHLFQLAMIQ